MIWLLGQACLSIAPMGKRDTWRTVFVRILRGLPLTANRFVHQAIVYDTTPGLIAVVAPIVERVLHRGGSPIVVLDRPKADALHSAIGMGSGLEVLDPGDIYTRPWQTYASYVDTVLERVADGDPILVVGEPPFATCNEDDATEWLRVEASLNLALAEVDGLMLCPYNTATAGAAVMARTGHVHPEILSGEGGTPSLDYVDPHAYLAAARGDALRELGAPDFEMAFALAELGDVRRAVAFEAEIAGLANDRIPDFVLAVSELAANSVQHGGGAGTVRLWARRGEIVCEIEDHGVLGDSSLGMLALRRGDGGRHLGEAGRGLWIARQLVDAMTIVSRPTGTIARLSMHEE